MECYTINRVDKHPKIRYDERDQKRGGSEDKEPQSG